MGSSYKPVLIDAGESGALFKGHTLDFLFSLLREVREVQGCSQLKFNFSAHMNTMELLILGGPEYLAMDDLAIQVYSV